MTTRPARACITFLGLVLAACAGKTGDDVTGGDPTGSGTTGSGGESSSGTAGTGGESSTDAPTGGPEPTGTTTTATTSASTGTTGTTGDDTGGDALVCPAAIDAAILACVADLQADPELAENNFLLDLLLMCADAEPVADDYDAHCADAPADPICALEYFEFVDTVLPECIDRAREVLFADVCLLPEQYADLLFTPAIALMQRRFVVAPGELDATEQQQLLAASADMGFPAATVEEALLATDDDGFDQVTVLDVGTDRALVAYSAHYGDTRVGRVFFRGTLVIVGAIEDGFFTRCAVERAIEGQPCTGDGECGGEHTCVDVLVDPNDMVLAAGACVWPAALSGEGDACTLHDDCGPFSGLLCLDTLAGGDGQCRPGWMRRTFAGADAPLVAGGTASIPIPVSGVATVANAAHLDLQLSQTAANALALRLVNPGGTATPITATDATSLVLDLEPVAVPSDESVGGIWHLLIEDVGGAAEGAVTRVGLTLDTRWD